VKKTSIQYLDFEIDKLTRSIENVTTGDSFPTEISYLTKTDLKTVLKKNGWGFDWKKELSQAEREVYKLTILNNPNILQGLLSLSIEEDHVYMHLIESALLIKAKEKFIMEFLEI
jgi:hypothetical protein